MSYPNRYIPQMRIPEIGAESQEKLAGSTVLIVGCGALGSPLAMYLAGAGVGKLVLYDFDTIELSNLHRQVFYTEQETGMSKSEILKKRIESLNSEIEVEAHKEFLTIQKLLELNHNFNIIADTADNPATTYMLDKYCRHNDIYLSTAGVVGWDAQIFTYIPGSTPYSMVFPEPKTDSGILPCSLTGIMGQTSAFAASLQGAEIIKCLLGLGEKNSRLVTANLLTLDFNKFIC